MLFSALVHCRVHISPPPAPVFSQINPAHRIPSNLSEISFSIFRSSKSRYSSHFSLHLLQPELHIPCSYISCYMQYQSHVAWHNHSVNIWWRIQVTDLPITQLFLASLLHPSYFDQNPVLISPHPVCSVNAWSHTQVQAKLSKMYTIHIKVGFRVYVSWRWLSNLSFALLHHVLFKVFGEIFASILSVEFAKSGEIVSDVWNRVWNMALGKDDESQWPSKELHK